MTPTRGGRAAVEAAEHNPPAAEHEQLPDAGERFPAFTEQTITDPTGWRSNWPTSGAGAGPRRPRR